MCVCVCVCTFCFTITMIITISQTVLMKKHWHHNHNYSQDCDSRFPVAVRPLTLPPCPYWVFTMSTSVPARGMWRVPPGRPQPPHLFPFCPSVVMETDLRWLSSRAPLDGLTGHWSRVCPSPRRSPGKPGSEIHVDQLIWRVSALFSYTGIDHCVHAFPTCFRVSFLCCWYEKLGLHFGSFIFAAMASSHKLVPKQWQNLVLHFTSCMLN